MNKANKILAFLGLCSVLGKTGNKQVNEKQRDKTKRGGGSSVDGVIQEGFSKVAVFNIKDQIGRLRGHRSSDWKAGMSLVGWRNKGRSMDLVPGGKEAGSR